MSRITTVLGGLALLLAVHTGAMGTQSPALLQTDLKLDLTIHYDSGTIGGVAVLTVRNVGDAPADRVPIQLGRLMHVTAVSDAAGTAMPFTQDVVTYDDWPQLQVCQVYVTLLSALDVGGSQSVSIQYGGTLVGYTETGMLYVRDHVDSAFTIIRTDARALPVLTGPSIVSLRSQPRSDFTYEARITVPPGLTVATGTAESERIRSGDGVTWVFEGSKPVPFLNISVAPYAVLGSGGVRVFYFPEDSAGAQVVMDAVDRATSLLGTWFGPLKDSPRLHVIEIPDGWGSQASLTGGIIQTASTFRDPSRLGELYHELSHLWNVHDLDVPSPRWNEGLSMFLQARLSVALNGGDSLEARMSRALKRARGLVDRTPALTRVPLAEYGRNNMTDYSYTTAELMFYLLFGAMGAEQFDSTMRDFLQTYGDTGATTAEMADWFRKSSTSSVARILEDWLTSARWAERVGSGASLQELIPADSDR